MFILYKEVCEGNWEPVGYFPGIPQAVCALEAEREKNDGDRFMIEEDKDGQQAHAE